MGRNDKRKHQNEDVYITILVLQYRKISETAGAAGHEEVFQCDMSGSMDELDNRRMSLSGWWPESRERRRDFMCFILEKSCLQQ